MGVGASAGRNRELIAGYRVGVAAVIGNIGEVDQVALSEAGDCVGGLPRHSGIMPL
jgi:hypothetical protein